MAVVPQASNLRLVDPPTNGDQLEDIIIEHSGLEPDDFKKNDSGSVLEIEHGDGSITVSLDGSPLIEEEDEDNPQGWFDNLAKKIDSMELSRIANDLLRGIEDDLNSRKEWVEELANGIKLLGLKLELPGSSGAGEAAPVEGMSKVRHPLLLEAVLRFQANARSELLPTDGPVKIRDDSTTGSTPEQDKLATALQKDMNHYLTSTAKEYYPDTDRMLLMLGLGGSAFKKVYKCPLRNRPVSESVSSDDLIVNNSASSLADAKRITHRIQMRPSVVKRMQLIGAYIETDLITPSPTQPDAVKQEKAAQQGVSTQALNPEDRDREIYECYCELDIVGFEHKKNGKPTGLEIPYRVTIDVSSRQILSIVRNYDEKTQELPVAKCPFVHYLFVPGLGFYGIGLLHILGNTTNAVTAAWREMLDAGMFANFPGFLFTDASGRQNTTIFRVPPGGGAPIKTGGMKINDAVMPLPYKEPGQALMSLVDNMAQTGMRVGGIAEIAVGEGRQDAPVGTTIAMIDQATKVLNAVHKRMHTAQAEEFSLLLDCFKEEPQSFWQGNRKPAYPWTEESFMKAVEDAELVPQADPNTASQTQRLMKIVALKQLQSTNQRLYDPIAVDTAALQAIGWSNPEQFFVPTEAMNQPDPSVAKEIEELKIKGEDVNVKKMLAEAKVAETQHKISQVPEGPDLNEHALKMADLEVKSSDAILDAHNREADRESRERLALVNLAKEVVKDPEALARARSILPPELLQRLVEPG